MALNKFLASVGVAALFAAPGVAHAVVLVPMDMAESNGNTTDFTDVEIQLLKADFDPNVEKLIGVKITFEADGAGFVQAAVANTGPFNPPYTIENVSGAIDYTVSLPTLGDEEIDGATDNLADSGPISDPLDYNEAFESDAMAMFTEADGLDLNDFIAAFNGDTFSLFIDGENRATASINGTGNFGATGSADLKATVEYTFMDVPPVDAPEPGTLALIGAGAAAVGVAVRRRRKA